MKKCAYSTNIAPNSMKIQIRVVLTSLNNFLLILEVDFIWPKWCDYAPKFDESKKKKFRNKYIINYIKYPYLHKIQVIKTESKVFNMC